MQNKFRLLLLVLAGVLMSSCGTTYKGVSYLQDSKDFGEASVNQPLYDARIMPKDLLTISVSTTDPLSAVPFNLTVPTAISTTYNYPTSQPSLQQYLVSNGGSIDFPVLGEIIVGGLTKSEAEELIQGKLRVYLNETEDPIVNVRMTNYKISVLGEVQRPGTFTISNEKVNVFEALAMAGDLTIYGVRDNVKLIREDADGNRKIVEFSLNDSEVITSPYYYLQQNDVIYVTPNKTRAKDSDISASKTIWLSVTSTLVSVATFLVTVLVK